MVSTDNRNGPGRTLSNLGPTGPNSDPPTERELRPFIAEAGREVAAENNGQRVRGEARDEVHQDRTAVRAAARGQHKGNK